MRKLTIFLFTFLFTSAFLLAGTNAFAFTSVPTYWDLTAVDIADNGVNDNYFNKDDGVTELFNQLTYYAETTSYIDNFASVGSTIVDHGRAKVTGQNFVSGNDPGDNEGFKDLYGMTFLWDNLTGTVNSNDGSTITATYTSGTIDFYIDYNPYQINLNDDASMTDGLKVATIEVTKGFYSLSLDGNAGSSYLLYGTFTYLLDNFWYTEDGIDLADTYLGLDWVLAYTAGDNDPEDVDISTNTSTGEVTVISNHDSSISVGVVPEPATFALFGMALLGLAGITRRKQN